MKLQTERQRLQANVLHHKQQARYAPNKLAKLAHERRARKCEFRLAVIETGRAAQLEMLDA